jgi:hypothetical protein
MRSSTIFRQPIHSRPLIVVVEVLLLQVRLRLLIRGRSVVSQVGTLESTAFIKKHKFLGSAIEAHYPVPGMATVFPPSGSVRETPRSTNPGSRQRSMERQLWRPIR